MGKRTKNGPTDAIKVAIGVSGSIIAAAKGRPALLLACGTAAAVAFVGVGIGYGAYLGARGLAHRLLGEDQ